MPVTTISPVTVKPVNSSMTVLNTLPSTVEIWNVLFAIYQSVSETPATDTSAAAVIRPSSSTVNVGIKEAEP